MSDEANDLLAGDPEELRAFVDHQRKAAKEQPDLLGARCPAATVSDVVERVRSYRTLGSTEIEIQDQLARILAREGIAFEREYHCGAAGRIDFYLPAFGAGLEVKIAGSLSEVIRQLQRYAGVQEIGTLLVYTRRARHGHLPERIGDVAVHVICPWEGAL